MKKNGVRFYEDGSTNWKAGPFRGSTQGPGYTVSRGVNNTMHGVNKIRKKSAAEKAIQRKFDL